MKSETSCAERMECAVHSRANHATRTLLRRSLVLMTIDLILGCIAFMSAWMIRTFLSLPFTQSLLPEERWVAVDHPWVTLIATQLLFPYVFGLFDDVRRIRYREILSFVLAACLLQFLTIASVFFLTNRIYPRTVILIFGQLNFVLLCLWRAYVKRQAAAVTTRVVVIGEEPQSCREIIREIEDSPWMGLKIIGVVYQRLTGSSGCSYPILGAPEEIARIVSEHAVDEIIFASEPSWKDHFLNSLSRLHETTPIRIAILPSPFEMVIGKLRHVNIHDTPLIEVSRNPNQPIERFVKRAFDIVISSAGLLLASPFIAPVAVAIKLTSPGPVFYAQERVGFGGRLFKVIKFRTMVQNAENDGEERHATENDPRVTVVGRLLRRFRIDEIPQLLNVVKGDMSFVGPRPERPGFVEFFSESVPGYSERHRVKPGITGLAQVRSYYHTTAETKLKYDLAYIYNYSFSLDLLILLQTIKVILVRKGS
jgi:exopolysaccharide biosynthesis polyprenyl glycosylphosphotransferase